MSEPTEEAVEAAFQRVMGADHGYIDISLGEYASEDDRAVLRELITLILTDDRPADEPTEADPPSVSRGGRSAAPTRDEVLPPGLGIVRLSDCETFTLGERTYDEPTEQHGYEVNQGGFISDEALTSGRWALAIDATTAALLSRSAAEPPEDQWEVFTAADGERAIRMRGHDGLLDPIPGADESDNPMVRGVAAEPNAEAGDE